MKKRMFVVGLFLMMFIVSGFTASYIKKNYARTLQLALKFSGVRPERIIHQQEEQDHIDLFLTDGADLTLVIVQVKEKKGRKNYEITQTNKMEKLFSEEDSSRSNSETIKNQLEMLASIEDTPFSFEEEIHKSFGKRLFFIGTSQNKKIKNLRIDGQKPTNIFTYNYKGIVNYVYYYEELKLDHKEIKVRM
ncbi:hypothetical protein A5821_000035 [Enterococcus sp. 7F3_DIV0205]|uniref:Uncharacterized protein n=1 Tax=Candidatus Enterococcus palustris TaxID=1834189 RepID=A0AAQ3Y612_9ENTE|nr:hypothetical protein [Enterococcus sp. 7F3_DIV0205]OTN84441.1 hypothetical protein A5821_000369 [Enterococcus sp. 7F3_DIV0205]